MEDHPSMTPNEIRDIRIDLGMTQDAFARALGVFLRTVQRWEAGTTGIPEKRAEAARALRDRRTSNTRARATTTERNQP